MTKDEFITERTRIISEMLDNPNELEIYPTTKCFEQLDELFDKIVADEETMDYKKLFEDKAKGELPLDMKIYLVTRTDDYGYDEYDSAVVIEKTPKKAMEFCEKYFNICEKYFNKGKMTCELIGTATRKQKAGSVLASFNAG